MACKIYKYLGHTTRFGRLNGFNRNMRTPNMRTQNMRNPNTRGNMKNVTKDKKTYE